MLAASSPPISLSTYAPWASELRANAAKDFAARGLPTRRDEAWRYSDLSASLRATPAAGAAKQHVFKAPAGIHIELIDAALTSAPKAPGVKIVPLSEVLSDPASQFTDILANSADAQTTLITLNTAHLAAGLAIVVEKGVTLKAPIHLDYTWSPGAHDRHARALFVLEEGASATLIETHSGAPSFATCVTQIHLAHRATLAHSRLESLASDARLSATLTADLAKDAAYKAFYLSLGAFFSRHEVHARLMGENALVSLDGVSILSKARHCDNTTFVTHAAPRASSRQVFRAVADDAARGVYQGCIRVQQSAQQTDARQLSKSLLLSHDAKFATKPELEIFADDVKCSHGATSGELDPAALFYLQARAIPEAQARALLVDAFLREAIATIENEDAAALADHAISAWLSNHGAENAL